MVEMYHAGCVPLVRAILAFCERRIRAILQEFPHCTTPALLLEALANKLRTIFVIIRTDTELHQIRNKYVSQGDTGFASLEEELCEGVYEITIRRAQRKFWEPEFVSIIDCRGDKAARSYYTKWHEIGHLLITPDGSHESFRRTHCEDVDLKDPIESIVDVIAGAFGFFPDMVRENVTGTASFELIEAIRQRLCPEASR
jgi:hypothetical protein